MPVDFGNILKIIKDGIVDIATTSLKDFSQEAIADGHAILDTIEPKLKKWTHQLAAGEIDQDLFKDLILGEKNIMQLVALKHKGLAMIKADEFKAAVLNLIINTVTAAI